jgi:hypothetical protein
MPWGNIGKQRYSFITSLARRLMGPTATMVMMTKRKILAPDGNKITVD